MALDVAHSLVLWVLWRTHGHADTPLQALAGPAAGACLLIILGCWLARGTLQGRGGLLLHAQHAAQGRRHQQVAGLRAALPFLAALHHTSRISADGELMWRSYQQDALSGATKLSRV